MKVVIEVNGIQWKLGLGQAVNSKMTFELTEVADAETGKNVKIEDMTDEQLKAMGQYLADVMIKDLEKKFGDTVISYSINVKLGDNPTLPN